jgi:gas vesicle protein
MRQKENIFEELNRMKYLINSKPGTVISEQDYGAVSSYAAAGALTGAGMGAGVFSVPGALIGGAVGAIYGLLQNSTNSDGAKKILQACRNKQTVGPASQSRQQLNAIADALNTAIEGVGTDEKAIKANLQKITTIPDLCAMSTIYQTRHGESLWDALDGDIDEQAEWKNYVYLPLLDAYENSVELGKKVKAAPAGAAPAGAAPAATKGAVAGAVKGGGQRAQGGGQRAQGGGQRAQGGGQSSVNSRFASSAQSLGVQNPKMDVATLQTMLKSLQGGTPTAAPTQGAPDTAQLNAALNQLKQ